MIFPLRVFGSFSVMYRSSGTAMDPISSRTCFWRSLLRASERFAPPFRTTYATRDCPFTGWGFPTTAASATFGWLTSADSTSIVPIRCPATLITSSIRPMSQRYPSSSTRAPSPVKYFPGTWDQYTCLYRSGSPYRVWSIAGHGFEITRYPPLFTGTGRPRSSTTSASIPGNGRVADPGFVVVVPGSGEMRIIPVSVCHHVSTIGQRPPPIVRWYHRHASGLIGSPTVPRRRRLDRSCRCGCSSPHRMKARIAVGAVYRIVMSYASIIRHQRSGSGQSGAPSYMKTDAPFARGPYTMYECPVTQPQSAVHQYRSPSRRSKTYFDVVAVPTR